MRLSKAAYYADFVVYPLLLIPLGATLLHAGRQGELAWAGACIAGIAGISLAEYAVHRFVLHRLAPFCRMHALHHAHPTALVGTPTWLSATLIAGAGFLPMWWLAGLNAACGLTFGLVLGYLWYVTVHYAVHRWPAKEGTYFHRAQRRHGQHHRSLQHCNFGVTTGCWDRVFASSKRELPCADPL